MFRTLFVILFLLAGCSLGRWAVSLTLEGKECSLANSFTFSMPCAASPMTVWIDNVKGSFQSFYFNDPTFGGPTLNFFTDSDCSKGNQYVNVDPNTCIHLIGNGTGCTPYTCSNTWVIDIEGENYQLTGFNYTFF